MAGMAGLMSALGCGSLRQPESLAGPAQSPAGDAGLPRPANPPDTSSPSSPDAGPSDGTTPDGGAADAATIVSPLASSVAAQNVGKVDALAIDGATLYGLTSDNTLWVLGAGSAAPRLLARDAAPDGIDCGPMSRLALNTVDLFWLAPSTDAANDLFAGLHRTEKSGASDTVIATGIAYAQSPMVAADDTRVYWIEGDGSSDFTGPGGVIHALPVDAAPGTTPTTVVAVNGAYAISTMALAGPTLYWADFYLYTTMFHAELYGEAVSDLLASQPPAPADLGESWFVQPHDGDLYVEAVIDLWHQDLARRSPDGGTVNLAPIGGVADSIVFVDDWALVSVPSGACGDYRHQLIAVHTTAPGEPVIQLADDLSTPAVLGTELAFVDLMGQVHTSTLDQVRAALAVASR